MSQSWEKCCSNRQMNKLGPSDPLSGKQEFHQKIRLHQFWVFMVSHLHAKYIKKWVNPKKNAAVTDKLTNWAILSIFGPILGKLDVSPQKLGFTTFEHLWSQNLIKNIKKN